MRSNHTDQTIKSAGVSISAEWPLRVGVTARGRPNIRPNILWLSGSYSAWMDGPTPSQ